MAKEYIPTLNTSIDTAPVSLTDTPIHDLRNSLSKSFLKILIALYHSPHMPQKVLAANIQTSPTSLSNIISRMSKVTPQLLTSERKGRIVYYSLTPIAEQYVEQEVISPDLPPAASFVVHLSDSALSSDNPIMTEARLLLSQFQTNAGTDWAIAMDNYLCYELNDNITESNSNQDLYNIYKRFVNNMTRLKLQEDHLSISQIYSALNNTILAKRIDTYFDYRLDIYYSLLPLFDLEKKNVKEVFMLIDHIFTQISPTVFRQNEVSTEYATNLPINKKDYLLIKDGLKSMSEKFYKYNGNVRQAVTHWQEQFLTTSSCLYFIALKCETIYYAETIIKNENTN